MTKKRSELVNKKFLLIASKKIFTINDIKISNSIQKSNKQTMDNIFSDIIESIIGAIFIDSNLTKTKKFIHTHILSKLNDSKVSNINYRGILLEKCHELKYREPVFNLTEHEETNLVKFKATVIINNNIYTGKGLTKKEAQVNAAKEALKEIQ